MKKLFILILCFFFICGCTNNKDNTSQDTSNGPIVSEDTLSDEEKILKMVQSCINDYNKGSLDELRAYYKSDIPNLPVEIDALPEITSLSDLTEVELNETISNTVYAGSYLVNDKYQVIFEIFYASGGDFWPNGKILFQIDPSLVTENDPQFSEYRTALEYLLNEEKNVVDALYGANTVLNEDSVIDDRYYEVISIGDQSFTSIEEIKAYAESVFTLDYLQSTYYTNAFDSETPIYKEENGKLYCLASDVTPLVSNSYAPEYIVAVKENDTYVTVNLLTKVMDQILPDIKEIQLQKTDNGYRLMTAG